MGSKNELLQKIENKYARLSKGQKRLADFILNEASIEGTNILKITHETIGNHLGNPREVVTRMLKYFVNEGFISLSRGTIEIIDKDGLEKIIVR